MKTEQIHVKIENEIKEEFALLCNEMGLNISQGIRLLIINETKLRGSKNRTRP